MVERRVDVHSGLGLGDEPVHGSIGADTAGTGYRLTEVVVHRGPGHALDTL